MLFCDIRISLLDSCNVQTIESVDLIGCWPVSPVQHLQKQTLQRLQYLHITSSRLVLVNIAEEHANLCNFVSAVSFHG